MILTLIYATDRKLLAVDSRADLYDPSKGKSAKKRGHDDDEEEEEEENSDAPKPVKRAKTRGHKSDDDENSDAPKPVKKARKTRRVKKSPEYIEVD